MAAPINIVLKEYADLAPIQLEVRERAIKAFIEDADAETRTIQEKRLFNKRPRSSSSPLQGHITKRTKTPSLFEHYEKVRGVISTTCSDIPYAIRKTSIEAKEVNGQKYKVFDYGALPTRDEVMLSHMMFLSRWEKMLAPQQKLGYRKNRYHVILSNGLFRVSILMDEYWVAIHVVKTMRSGDWKEISPYSLRVIHYSPYNSKLESIQYNKCANNLLSVDAL